jgi:hypothetical protein
VTVAAGKAAVTLTVDARPGATVGVWAAAHGTDLLAGALGRDVRVVRR